MRFAFISLALLAIAVVGRADEPATPKPILVPYRLTKTNHVLVRAKINGKGPYNFILDTGAPALFVARKTADAAGVAADKRGWAKFDRFEVEGGVSFVAAGGKVDDLFQLEGMNGLGLAGVELHGVIGYNLLARYRIEYDFTRPKLAWTRLDYEPPVLGGLGGRSAPAGLEVIGGMMKFLGGMMGVRANFTIQPRGFLGLEVADGGVRVSRVLARSPAAEAGIAVGDVVVQVGESRVKSLADLTRAFAGRSEKEAVSVTVLRDGRERQIKVELGRGL